MAKAQPKTKQTGDPITSPAFAEIELSRIDSNPWQPRATAPTDEELADLMNSVKAVGQRVPILVRPRPDKPGRYQVGDGMMRKLVAAKLGLKTVRAMVEQLTDKQMKILAIAANTFIRMRDSDKESAIYKLWESEYKTDEPDKRARKDTTYSGLREMERDTGIDHAMILRYLQGHETRNRIVQEAPKEVKAAVRELSNKDMAALAPVAKEAPKLAREIAAARGDDEIRSRDVAEIVRTYKDATPAEKVRATEEIITAKREEAKAIQKARDATDARVAEIRSEAASPEERTKRAKNAEAEREEASKREEAELLRQAAITKEREDGKQLQDFINLEMAAKNWVQRTEANTGEDIERRVKNVRNQNVARETVAKIRSIAGQNEIAARKWAEFAARFKE